MEKVSKINKQDTPYIRQVRVGGKFKLVSPYLIERAKLFDKKSPVVYFPGKF